MLLLKAFLSLLAETEAGGSPCKAAWPEVGCDGRSRLRSSTRRVTPRTMSIRQPTLAPTETITMYWLCWDDGYYKGETNNKNNNNDDNNNKNNNNNYNNHNKLMIVTTTTIKNGNRET